MDRKSYLYASLVCLLFVTVALLPIVWPAIAHAQDEAAVVVETAKTSSAVEYVKSAADPLIDTLALIIAGVLSAFAGVGLAWLKKKWNIDAGAQVESAIQDIIGRGIGYAAEKAHKAAKAGEGAPAGAQKLRDALEYVEDEVQRLGYDVLARDKLTALIESRLGVARVMGTMPTAEKTPLVKTPEG